MPLTSVSNKINGVAGWDKSVTDVNNVDENFANARDLGYSRLNRTRISVIGRLGKYDSSDMYRVQVQSNGKLFVNIRNGDSVEADNARQKAYEAKLKELEQTLSDTFWNIELVQNLETSVVNSPYINVFWAAACRDGSDSLFNEGSKFSNLITTMGDVHHIFPKQYLIDNGIKDKVRYNQVANFTYLDTPTIIMGPGFIECCHALDERIPVDHLPKAALIYALTAIEFCGN